MKLLFEFIGVDYFEPKDFTPKNVAVDAQFIPIKILTNRYPSLKRIFYHSALANIRTRIKRFAVVAGVSSQKTRTCLDVSDWQMLASEFEDEIHELSCLLCRDLTHWLNDPNRSM